MECVLNQPSKKEVQWVQTYIILLNAHKNINMNFRKLNTNIIFIQNVYTIIKIHSKTHTNKIM